MRPEIPTPEKNAFYIHFRACKTVASREGLCYTRPEFETCGRLHATGGLWPGGCRGGGKDIGRVDVSKPASISAAVAGRYATAVFDLCHESGALGAIESDVAALEGALAESADLRELTTSPLYSREAQARAVAALAGKMGLSPIMSNTLALMSENRRLFALPQLLSALKALIAEAKGEMTADVISAQPLSAAQADRLAASLKAQTGKTVKLNISVDEALIGGLIVKLGSKMIDTSVAAKLASLQNAMKEVG
ncbi:ATP synthase F1 subcomplex delta subunit [Phaeovulum veldkampii DSM 11550]|nr:ATP synthase F1 subcomplex delta subunit [Phaeovulum veldkampii DSM 11550]